MHQESHKVPRGLGLQVHNRKMLPLLPRLVACKVINGAWSLAAVFQKMPSMHNFPAVYLA